MLEYEARQLERTARALGVAIGPGGWSKGVDRQSIFHLSQFTLLLHDFERRENRLGFSYFHGRPGTPGMPEFDACFETLRRRHAEIDRVQVTSSAMQELILETGIARREAAPDPDRDRHRRLPPAQRAESTGRSPGARASRVRVRRGLVPEGRRRLGRRAGAEADQGPGRADRRRRASARAGARAGGLLTGPSRGYVRAGLERLGVPIVTRCSRPSTPSRRHTRPSTSVSSPRGTRGAARGPRIHGDRGTARDDARRAGARPRAAWRERLDRGGGGRGRPPRVGTRTSRERPPTSSRPSSMPGGGLPTRTPTTRFVRGGESSSGASSRCPRRRVSRWT